MPQNIDDPAVLLTEAREHSERIHALMKQGGSIDEITQHILFTQFVLQRLQILAMESLSPADPAPVISLQELENALREIRSAAIYSQARILLAKFEIRPRQR